MVRKTVWRKCGGCTATTSRRFCWICALDYIEKLEAQSTPQKYEEKSSLKDPSLCNVCATVIDVQTFLYVNENFTKAGSICGPCLAGFRRTLLRNGGKFTVT